MAQIVLITSGTSWDVPADFNVAANTVEVWGAGAGGVNNNFSVLMGAGGGGAYSKIVNWSGSGSIALAVGAPGLGETATSAPTAGGDTWFNGANLAASSVGAKGGAIPAATWTGGLGGPSASGVGTTKNSGGPGGAVINPGGSGAGGGGAGQLSGVGGTGANGVAGSGNGGAGGASAGAAGAGGTSGTPAGANGADNPAGGGGGGGNSSAANGLPHAGNGGFPGGGGGSGNVWQGNDLAGNGAGGLILITYTPITLTKRARRLSNRHTGIR